jgi:S-adenosylmethionine hydrolase
MILTLLTDFGLTDYYVAAVKGTVLRLAPGTVLVDISHDVPAGDVETASFLLAAASPSFPAGTVHLAVVDPGVGSERRILAARTPSGFFLAPDNGLLTPLLEKAGEIRSVERPDLFLPSPGQTFHGRDRFGPAAAWLLRGEPFAALGPVVDDPVRLPIPPPRRASGEILGRVAHIDRYGNLVTDIPAAWLGPEGQCRIEVGTRATGRRVACYAEIPSGEAAYLSGSLGTIELSLNGESLSHRWDVTRGTAVRVVWSAQSTGVTIR